MHEPLGARQCQENNSPKHKLALVQVKTVCERHRALLRLAAAFLLAMALLTACARSPEQAIIQEVTRPQTHMQVNPASIEILQTQSWQRNVFALVTFQVAEENNQISECLFMYDARRSPLGWAIGGGGGGCGPVGEDDAPIGISSGQHGSTRRLSHSHVKGLVYHEDVEVLEVIWDDGERQRAEIINDSFLAVRGGFHEYIQIQALNEAGEVIYTHENPPPAPGKESHLQPIHPASQPANLPIFQPIGEHLL